MAMHADLPAPPAGPKWQARGLLVAGAAACLASAAHFADVYPFDPNVAFVVFVLGALVLIAGVVRRVTLPRKPDVLRALWAKAEPIKMAVSIRPVPVGGQAHVEYVADLWDVTKGMSGEPDLWVRLDRGSPEGVPWFVSVTDGQVAWVHGGADKRGPVILELGDRLVMPATLSSAWRSGGIGGKKWARDGGS
jgi:membrane protein implicated in regulation of membrane protease activity